MGVAVLGSLGTAAYRSELASSVPADVPPAQADAARDTLGGAVESANALPDALGLPLLDAARKGFAQALQVTAVASAALMVASAILAVVVLRGHDDGGEPEEQAVRETEPAPLVRLARAGEAAC